MSLEKPTHSPQIPERDIEGNTSREDPLYRILSAEEDTDWEYAFMGAIRNPSTTTTVYPIREEVNGSNLDEDNLKREQSLDYTGLTIVRATSDTGPIEIMPSEAITEIHEIQLPVTTAIKPEGSFTLAEDHGANLQPISCPASGFENIWSQEFISTPGVSFGIKNNSPNPYETAPLHLVEGREDPEDEGICMTSPSPTKHVSPMLSALTTPEKKHPQLKVNTITSLFKVSPHKPEEFFEKCDILKWAIDDQDIGEMPGVSYNQPPSYIPATVTSLTSSTPQPAKPQATTNLFIQEIKKETDKSPEEIFIPLPPKIATPMSRYSTGNREELPAAPKSRKRGRPEREEPREITPKLPKLPRGQTTSDSEYTYVSDSGGILTDDEVSALKYRRMRDLNNEASKRCRQTRKQKMAINEHMVNQLTEKNQKLKNIVEKMETQVVEMKLKFITTIQSPSSKIAMARRKMIGSNLGFDTNIIGSFMDTETQELPDIHAFWSV